MKSFIKNKNLSKILPKPTSISPKHFATKTPVAKSFGGMKLVNTNLLEKPISFEHFKQPWMPKAYYSTSPSIKKDRGTQKLSPASNCCTGVMDAVAHLSGEHEGLHAQRDHELAKPEELNDAKVGFYKPEELSDKHDLPTGALRHHLVTRFGKSEGGLSGESYWHLLTQDTKRPGRDSKSVSPGHITLVGTGGERISLGKRRSDGPSVRTGRTIVTSPPPGTDDAVEQPEFEGQHNTEEEDLRAFGPIVDGGMIDEAEGRGLDMSTQPPHRRKDLLPGLPPPRDKVEFEKLSKRIASRYQLRTGYEKEKD